MHVIIDKKTGLYNIVGLTPERYSQIMANMMSAAFYNREADRDLLDKHDRSCKIRKFYREAMKAIRELMESTNDKEIANIVITY